MFRILVLAIALTVSYAEAAKLPRISGGHETVIANHPHLLQLLDRKAFRCSACIISKYWAVTLTQCVEGIHNTSALTLQEGTGNINEDGKEHTVSVITRHPNYDPVHFNKDITLIQVREPFSPNSLKLATKDILIPPGTMATVAGWGYSSGDGPISKVVQEVDVPVISTEDCQKYYPDETVTDELVCTLSPEGGKGPCLGDGGDPLVVVDNNNNKIVIGLASWSYGCAEKGYPAVYTSIASYWEWITENTGIEY